MNHPSNRDQRRSHQWAWILGGLVVVVLVAGIAYYLGATQAGQFAFERPFHRMAVLGHGFGFAALGFWLPVLALAIIVGILVAALVRPSRPTETFEEWHRRAHHDLPASATHEHPSPAAGELPSSPRDEPPPGSSMA